MPRISFVEKISAASGLVLLAFCSAPTCKANSDAPYWMHSVANASLPAPPDEKTAAVLLYSDVVLSVQSNGKLKRVERRAYKSSGRRGEISGEYKPISVPRRA